MEPSPRPSLRRRRRDAHKHSVGSVLVIGGSVGLSGAPLLVGRGAQAVGAGLVTLAVPASIQSILAATDPSMLVVPMRATQSGALATAGLRELTDLSARVGAVVLGPGLGASESARATARALVGRIDRPLVLDADALNATPPPILSRARVSTPHEMEAARLLGWDVVRVRADREAAVRALVERLGGVVVLKGPSTLISDGRTTFSNPTGNPALARGGTGDVLAGVVATFLAEGMEPIEAACAAAWVHGAAADRGALRLGTRGLLLDDLTDAIRAVCADLEQDAG